MIPQKVVCPPKTWIALNPFVKCPFFVPLQQESQPTSEDRSNSFVWIPATLPNSVHFCSLKLLTSLKSVIFTCHQKNIRSQIRLPFSFQVPHCLLYRLLILVNKWVRVCGLRFVSYHRTGFNCGTTRHVTTQRVRSRVIMPSFTT